MQLDLILPFRRRFSRGGGGGGEGAEGDESTPTKGEELDPATPESNASF